MGILEIWGFGDLWSETWPTCPLYFGDFVDFVDVLDLGSKGVENIKNKRILTKRLNRKHLVILFGFVFLLDFWGFEDFRDLGMLGAKFGRHVPCILRILWIRWMFWILGQKVSNTEKKRRKN